MSQNEWIAAAEARLHERLGPPNDENERKNLRAYAESLATNETGYIEEGFTPQDAVDEDLSYAS